jgi:hypothetical protein
MDHQGQVMFNSKSQTCWGAALPSLEESHLPLRVWLGAWFCENEDFSYASKENKMEIVVCGESVEEF